MGYHRRYGLPAYAMATRIRTSFGGRQNHHNRKWGGKEFISRQDFVENAAGNADYSGTWVPNRRGDRIITFCHRT